jgi:DNA polymerase family A
MPSKTLVFLDLETYDRETGKGTLNPIDGEIRLLSVSTSINSAVVDKKLQPKSYQKIINRLIEYWNDPNCVFCGININFDLGFLQEQHPEFRQHKDTAQVVSLDLFMRCILGDYSDPQEKPQTQSSSPASFSNNARRQINPYGFSLVGVSKFLDLQYPLEENKFKHQKKNWGDNLIKSDYEYSLLDSTFPHHHIYPALIKLFQVSHHGNTILHTHEIESAYQKSALKLQQQRIRIDENELETNIKLLRNHLSELEQEWELSEKSYGLNASQTVALAKQWDVDSVSKMHYLTIKGFLDENPEIKTLFENRIKQSTTSKLLKELQKLKTGLKDGRTRVLWNSCNGTGRSTTQGKNTNYLNMQAIGHRQNRFSPPVKFRKLVIPREGCSFLNLDLPTSHMRIALALSKCENGRKFLSEGVDCHSVVASQLWGIKHSNSITWQEINHRISDGDVEAKFLRALAKQITFGRLNGSGALNLQTRISAEMFDAVELEIIKDLVTIVDITYPELKSYRSDLWRYLLNNVTYKVIKDELTPIYTLTGHNSFLAVNEKYRPHLQFVGQYHPTIYDESGKGAPDTSKPKQPKFTQVIASVWSRIEALMMKDFVSYCQANHPEWAILVFHYDSNLFEIPSQEWEKARDVLCPVFDYYFSKILCKWIPTGILEPAYLGELNKAQNWYDA